MFQPSRWTQLPGVRGKVWEAVELKKVLVVVAIGRVGDEKDGSGS